jgi:hypothetical protein
MLPRFRVYFQGFRDFRHLRIFDISGFRILVQKVCFFIYFTIDFLSGENIAWTFNTYTLYITVSEDKHTQTVCILLLSITTEILLERKI